MRRLTAPVRVPIGVPTPSNRRFRRFRATLDRIVYDVIERRRRQGVGDDLLSRLMEARDSETGERMDDRQLRDEVMTMFLAGHETTANALTWTWYLLSRHPDARLRVEGELSRVLGGRAPSLDDLASLPYTGMVLLESLRLYPPAWMFSRRAIEKEELGGYVVPKGAMVMVPPYVVHRHPGLWERPESFEPERFAPERSEGRPRLAFFPFGAGPRLCIGRDFALQEAQLVLATVAQRCRLELVPGHPVVPEPRITLRSKHGIRMRVIRPGTPLPPGQSSA
jgi:cytochrome P450